MARGLTKKQRGFVNNYADTGIGNLAVVEAGYAVSTDETARSIASENLTKPHIQEELKKLGFDSNNAKRVVAQILNSEESRDHDKLSAVDKVFKVNGDYAPEKHINISAEVALQEHERELASRLLQSQKSA